MLRRSSIASALRVSCLSIGEAEAVEIRLTARVMGERVCNDGVSGCFKRRGCSGVGEDVLFVKIEGRRDCKSGMASSSCDEHRTTPQ